MMFSLHKVELPRKESVNQLLKLLYAKN
jgi:hypothetical protein